MNKPRIDLVLIGLGNVADYQIKALSHLEQFRIIAACDKEADKRGKLPGNIPFFTELDDLLNENDIENVVISVPPAQRLDMMTYCLRAGKNILAEKPLVVSILELNRLLQIVKESRGILVTAFHAAFGKELSWFRDIYYPSVANELGPVSFFHCNFYDPYVVRGELQSCARNLGGSWLDSGINALSVVNFILQGAPLHLEEARPTTIPQICDRDIQSTVEFSFASQPKDRYGYGLIDTNWTLGLNRKTTTLRFLRSKSQVVLHHSNQQVILEDDQRCKSILADFSELGERLVIHYKGVFSDFAQHLLNKKDNLNLSHYLHNLLFFSVTANHQYAINY